jgi:hypothetical protein
MSVPDWPETLPQNLLIDGYGESPPDLLLRSSMEAGPAKVRRRATAGIRPVKGKMVLTGSQVDIFDDFYNNVLLGGSLRFSWVKPRDGTTAVEMRITEKSYVAIEPDEYELTLSLEILP